jgi:hypothetical protein
MGRIAVTALHHTETTLVLALASIAAGLLVEDIGSRIESRFLDKEVKCTTKRFPLIPRNGIHTCVSFFKLSQSVSATFAQFF